MKIGPLDTQAHVVIVAEIGNNHEGDLTRARRMIQAAAEAGADAVKFQTIIPERLVCAEQQERLAQLRRFQLSRADHEALAAEAANRDAVFLSTPFAIDAVDWLDALVPAYKVASGDNDFWPLLERLAMTRTVSSFCVWMKWEARTMARRKRTSRGFFSCAHSVRTLNTVCVK